MCKNYLSLCKSVQWNSKIQCSPGELQIRKKNN
jgi:hypothetical protein